MGPNLHLVRSTQKGWDVTFWEASAGLKLVAGYKISSFEPFVFANFMKGKALFESTDNKTTTTARANSRSIEYGLGSKYYLKESSYLSLLYSVEKGTLSSAGDNSNFGTNDVSLKASKIALGYGFTF